MAPLENAGVSPYEGMNGIAEVAPNENRNSVTNGSFDAHADGYSKVYTDAYTHGYVHGYITGHQQPRTSKQMPIAIVGMSCRLPGNVTTPDEFWELCSRARNGWSEIPKERFENASFHHPNPGKGGCFNAIGGNFLTEDLGLFDAPFFTLTAQEATSMDPQQRILLECTFEALESAGIPKHQIVGKKVGVFIGGSFSEYESQLYADTETIPMYQATGCALAMQSNRISHFFDLQGPSLSIDTACSSSLVALHQACQSLRSGESKSAIVGGCHLNILPETWISMSNSRLFSDEGKSFSFDSRGTGFGRGEGCGVVILKPLDQALKDNDKVRCVIAASGVNQDGRTSGITLPNGSAQESLIQSVYQNAGIDPKDTGYVEGHGTGTKVGDPIEAAALYKVFNESRSARNPLWVGSVKSNIGHLEATSGLVSVIKTAMMLERGFILPNHDFRKSHEKIPFSKWNLKIPVSQRPWPSTKRFASVNNFGFGGTNAHVVLERAPFLDKIEPELEPTTQSRKLFVLSANDRIALETLMKKLGIYLEQRPEVFQNDLMSNVAYTLGQRRSLMQWRIAISATSSFDLIQALNSGKINPAKETEPPRIGFIFTGQGAQWNAMGRELYEQYPVFASTIDACDSYLTSLGASFSLIVELQKNASTSLVDEAHISQPACTAVQIALTDLLRSWGVLPTAVAGHSSGEISAAYAADILPLGSCMAIAYERGMAAVELKRKHSKLRGAMMAVGCSEENILSLIDQLTVKGVGVACFNSPSSLTISGDEPAIDELQKMMEQKQIFNRKLKVNVAYHSHHMKLIAEDYRESLQTLNPKSTQIKFHSSLFGGLIDGSKLDASYWVDNLTHPVRFSEALSSMCGSPDGDKASINMIVEIGPHSALAGPVKQTLMVHGVNTPKISYSSALVRGRDAVETAMELASTLFVKGVALNLGAINLPKLGKKLTLLVDMPRYPWNHQTKYWHESRIMQKHKNRTAPRNDLLGTLANYSNDMEPTWRNVLRIDDLPWLRHHKIQSLTLFPMAAFVALAIEATSQRAALRNVQYDSFELRNFSVNTPLMITDEGIEITLQLRPHQGGILVSSHVWDEFRIHSWAVSKGWTEHCKGLIAVKGNECNEENSKALLRSTITEITSAATSLVDQKEMYDSLSDLGVSYGPSFQGINSCQASDSYSMANIVVADTAQDMPLEFQSSMIVHPTLLEQLIEMYWPILGAGRTSLDTVYLPSSIGRLTISRYISEHTKAPPDSLQAFCKATRAHLYPKSIQMSMFATAANETEKPLIMLDDLTISPILERDLTSKIEIKRELCYKLDWEPVLQPVDSSTSLGDTNGVSDCHLNKVNEHSNGVSDYSNGVSHHSNSFSNHLNGVSDSSNGISDHSDGVSDYLGKLSNGTLKGITNGISKKPHGGSDLPEGAVTIVHGDSKSQCLLASKLADALEQFTGERPDFGTLQHVKADGKLCVFLAELEQPLLSSLTPIQFTILQEMLTSIRGILWVVRGAYMDSSNPDAGMITGFSRSIRSETLLKFATLDLDSECTPCEEDTVAAILEVLKATFGPNVEVNCDLEFMERKGTFFTPRINNDEEMDEYVHKHTNASVLEPTLFTQDTRPLKMAIKTPGDFGTLYFVDQLMEEPLLDDEIEIEVKAVGVNSREVTVAMGHVEDSDFGSECSGVITKTGKDAVNFVTGNRVAGISVSQGVYAKYARIKTAFTLKISDDTSFEAAASIPIAYCTAYYGLSDLGRLLAEESIIIYGAATSVGQAAICLAQMMGAEVFATVGNIENKELLMKVYGLQDNHILSHSTSFGSAFRQEINRGCFDVVLNCLPMDDDELRDVWNCLGSFGRFVNISKHNDNASLGAVGFENNKSFMSVDFTSLVVERPKVIRQLFESISENLKHGKIEPISPITVFPISDVEKAFKLLHSGNVYGKLVILPRPGDEVKALVLNKQDTILRADASYILIGGTGGLGRSMARWMVGKGARNIVLVSRGGSATGKVKELIDDLASVGANIVVRRCDVSNDDSVKRLITNELAGMPEVRGVIHGAMVLHDVLFERMSYDEYTTVIRSKVKGAWNFHNALINEPLDFFVAISSAAGVVGNRGQAAYSAANTFLDAFIQYRVKLGLPACSIGLTAVSDAGYLAENLETAAEVTKNLGSDTICEAEVLALLGAAISGHLARTCNNHIITGVRITPSAPPFWSADAKFKYLRLAAEATAATEPSNNQAVAVSFGAALKATRSLDEAQDVVCKGLLRILGSVLMLDDAEDTDVTRSLSNYALDSLVAIEVRNFITREFEANLQVLELLSSGSIEALAKTICTKSKLVSF